MDLSCSRYQFQVPKWTCNVAYKSGSFGYGSLKRIDLNRNLINELILSMAACELFRFKEFAFVFFSCDDGNEDRSFHWDHKSHYGKNSLYFEHTHTRNDETLEFLIMAPNATPTTAVLDHRFVCSLFIITFCAKWIANGFERPFALPIEIKNQPFSNVPLPIELFELWARAENLSCQQQQRQEQRKRYFTTKKKTRTRLNQLKFLHIGCK